MDSKMFCEIILGMLRQIYIYPFSENQVENCISLHSTCVKRLILMTLNKSLASFTSSELQLYNCKHKIIVANPVII
jgi:hypothetical protein